MSMHAKKKKADYDPTRQWGLKPEAASGGGGATYCVGGHVVAGSNDAGALFRLLQAFSVEEEGRRLWQADRPGVVVPAFQVGYAGIAACLLRLGDPATAPHLLSGQAFEEPGRASPRRARVA